MPGGPEVLIIVAVLLLLFGGKKIPEFARSLGSAQREFREGLQEGGAADAATPASSATAPDPAGTPEPAGTVGLEPDKD